MPYQPIQTAVINPPPRTRVKGGDYEQSVIGYEYSRNLAMDLYFDARPNIKRDRETERIFEGGFRLAWEIREDVTK